MTKTINRLLLSVGVLVATVAQVDASMVLTFGDRISDRNNLASDFVSLGHTVTNVEILPLDLSAFDTIWHVGAFAPFTAAEQLDLANFLGNRGGTAPHR